MRKTVKILLLLLATFLIVHRSGLAFDESDTLLFAQREDVVSFILPGYTDIHQHCTGGSMMPTFARWLYDCRRFCEWNFECVGISAFLPNGQWCMPKNSSCILLPDYNDKWSFLVKGSVEGYSTVAWNNELHQPARTPRPVFVTQQPRQTPPPTTTTTTAPSTTQTTATPIRGGVRTTTVVLTASTTTTTRVEPSTPSATTTSRDNAPSSSSSPVTTPSTPSPAVTSTATTTNKPLISSAATYAMTTAPPCNDEDDDDTNDCPEDGDNYATDDYYPDLNKDYGDLYGDDGTTNNNNNYYY